MQWLSEKLKLYLFCMMQNGIVCKHGKIQIYSYIVKKRLVKDRYTLIEQSLNIEYPNRAFTDALDALKSSQDTILYEHIWSIMGHNWA